MRSRYQASGGGPAGGGDGGAVAAGGATGPGVGAICCAQRARPTCAAGGRWRLPRLGRVFAGGDGGGWPLTVSAGRGSVEMTGGAAGGFSVLGAAGGFSTTGAAGAVAAAGSPFVRSQIVAPSATANR